MQVHILLIGQLWYTGSINPPQVDRGGKQGKESNVHNINIITRTTIYAKSTNYHGLLRKQVVQQSRFNSKTVRSLT